MIRNLLYSLSLHLLLALVVYMNFNFQDFVELESTQPITVSFVALKEDFFPKINQKDVENIAKVKQSDEQKKEPLKPKTPPKEDKKKPEPQNSEKKVTEKPNNSKKDTKTKAIKASQSSENVEKMISINFSARERINVKQQIKNCYKKAIYETAAMSEIPIEVSVKLRIDGTIVQSSIKVINKEDYKSSPDNFNIALTNAKRTLQLCSPLRNLPADKYEIWQEMEFIFDASNI